MRSFRQTFRMLDQGLRPCQRPGCTSFGNVIDRRHHGVVCQRHATLVDDQPGDQLALFSTRPYELSH
jgi:hypothetical protein